MTYVLTISLSPEYAGGVGFEPDVGPDISIAFSKAAGRASPIAEVIKVALPKRINWFGDSRFVPDLICRLGTVIISKKFKSVLEAFDPVAHEFFYMPLFAHPNPTNAPHDFFAVNLAAVSNALDEGRSRLARRPLPQIAGVTYLVHNGFGGEGIVFKANHTVELHMWKSHDQPIYGRFFVSDALKAAVEKEHLIGPHFDLCR